MICRVHIFSFILHQESPWYIRNQRKFVEMKMKVFRKFSYFFFFNFFFKKIKFFEQMRKFWQNLFSLIPNISAWFLAQYEVEDALRFQIANKRILKLSDKDYLYTSYSFSLAGSLFVIASSLIFLGVENKNITAQSEQTKWRKRTNIYLIHESINKF